MKGQFHNSPLEMNYFSKKALFSLFRPTQDRLFQPTGVISVHVNFARLAFFCEPRIKTVIIQTVPEILKAKRLVATFNFSITSSSSSSSVQGFKEYVMFYSPN
jgi:hypothetical protein